MATDVYVRGERGKDGWVPIVGVAPLSQRFSVGSVSALAISADSISLVWVKITVDWTMALISISETLCIIYILLMCPARYGVMADLVGEFLVNSTYSESPLLPPELASDVKSLSGSAVNLGVAAIPYVVSACFGFVLILSMDSGVAVLGVVVLVSVGGAGANR